MRLKFQKQLYSRIWGKACKVDTQLLMYLFGRHLLPTDVITGHERSLPVKAADRIGETIKCMSNLHKAVDRDDAEVIHLVLNGDEDVDTRDSHDETPLHWACAGGSSEMVNTLLDLEADINARESKKVTPLEMACFCNNYSAVSALVRRGADMQTRDSKGFTLLHVVAQNGFVSLFNFLMQQLQVPDVNLKDHDGCTPLHRACQSGASPIVKELINSGADCSVTDASGCSPVHLAAGKGNLDIVEMLVKIIKDWDKPDGTGAIPLIKAAQSGHTAVVRMLIDNGSTVKLADSFGWTSLHHAAFNGHLDVARLVLTKGADPNAGTKHSLKDRIFLIKGECSGSPVWMYLFVFKYMLGLFLEEVKAGSSIKVCAFGKILLPGYGPKPPTKLVEKLAKTHFVYDVHDETPMHLACKRGDQAMVNLLLKEESIDLTVRDAEGFTPLHIAAIYGHIDAFEKLVPRYNETEISLALFLADKNEKSYLVGQRAKHADLDRQQKEARCVIELLAKVFLPIVETTTRELVNKLTSQLTASSFQVRSTRALKVAI